MARTNLVVLQPTSLCNLDCTYCYVPDRRNRNLIDHRILEVAFTNLASSDLIGEGIEFLWHAGEPLLAGLPFYVHAVSLQNRCFPRTIRIVNNVQTNATLIDDQWCEFFKASGFKIGVSVDGPAFLHDRSRTSLNGRGSHSRVTLGIKTLQKHGLQFGVLVVVTRWHLNHANALYDYLLENGFEWVGFNIEENEGAHSSSSISYARDIESYRSFFQTIYDRWMDDQEPFQIREFQDFHDAIRRVKEDQSYVRTPDEVKALSIITISREGEIFTYAPELAGASSRRYGHFSFGNVLREKIGHALLEQRLDITRDVERGIESCRQSCEYYAFCGGSYVSNRITEHDDFRISETNACLMHKKTLFEIVLSSSQRRARLRQRARQVSHSA